MTQKKKKKKHKKSKKLMGQLEQRYADDE